ncbi:VrrA/YqfQ family protein [Aquisalibacillus elongatus]|uniref:YqfQ-like protein n=1 Tax=Aquisalibacillus elongatus TaxID=485577 RepID=A0A3N5CAV5_9BACI|nr:VrrA/YqfQ family protein [Aquisalibacillus elongatus]RPF55825.1 YqfQ-like protein [Aquisalibacillus elongatus]
MDPFGYRPPNDFWNQNHYYQQPFQFHAPQRGGLNIISKFLGKQPYNPYPQQFFGYGPATGGMASKYATLHETLNHVQKGLGIIQQVSPYIKQYGPFVKNLPMVVDMVKIMMENDDEVDSDTHEDEHHSDDEQMERYETNEEKQPRRSSPTKEEKRLERERRHSISRDTQHVKERKPTPSKKKSTDEFPRPKLYI